MPAIGAWSVRQGRWSRGQSGAKNGGRWTGHGTTAYGGAGSQWLGGCSGVPSPFLMVLWKKPWQVCTCGRLTQERFGSRCGWSRSWPRRDMLVDGL